jgi:hypothetical protein
MWESHIQGEAAQVEAYSRERARDVRILNWRDAATGKPDDTETVLSGLGRGGEKRPGNGTSLAAYFIAIPLDTNVISTFCKAAKIWTLWVDLIPLVSLGVTT